MKKVCMLLLLFCLLVTAACSKPQTTEKSIRLKGKTEAVLYTVNAPVDGEVRGLILEPGERIRKGQPLFGLGTQDENPEVGKAAAEPSSAWVHRTRIRKWGKPLPNWPKPRPV